MTVEEAPGPGAPLDVVFAPLGTVNVEVLRRIELSLLIVAGLVPALVTSSPTVVCVSDFSVARYTVADCAAVDGTVAAMPEGLLCVVVVVAAGGTAATSELVA